MSRADLVGACSLSKYPLFLVFLKNCYQQPAISRSGHRLPLCQFVVANLRGID
jgi:hypothetical protein